MANYWVFVNGDVKGPYSLEQLIRVRGFSRRTQVCLDDGTGHPSTWVSPADLPELASVFQTVDQIRETPVSKPKPPRKPVVAKRPSRVVEAPAPAPVPAPVRAIPWVWIGVAAALLGGGAYGWHTYQAQQLRAQQTERAAVQALVSDKALPAKSQYGTLRQCIADRNIAARWEIERTPSGLFQVTLSWYTEPYFAVPGSAVYSFEVNPDVQSVRGLNTAAIQLLTEGFVIPPKIKPPPKVIPPSPLETFPAALDARREAIEKGDYDTVWTLFSDRKRDEMIQAGISQGGFVRLQNLTHRLESNLQQTILKTKKDDETHMLALLRQSQASHNDLFLKQQWVYENKAWKLDDEEKKTATTNAAPEEPIAPKEGALPMPAPSPSASPSMTSPDASNAPNASGTDTAPPAANPQAIPRQSLPGISN